MATDSHKVAIVVDPEFGDRLVALSRRIHVWICDTASNRAVAASIWASDPIFDLDSGVTTFKFQKGSSAAETVSSVLNAVDLHHGEHSHNPPWSVVEVIGCSPTGALTEEFAKFGAEIVSTGSDSFEARREVGVAG